MEQMPIQLDVAQAASSSEAYARPGVQNTSGKDGEFGQMMSQIQKRFGSKKDETLAAVIGKGFGTQTVDLLMLQQLAAMQMMGTDMNQLVVMQETAPEQQAMAAPVAQIENAPVEAAAVEVLPQKQQQAEVGENSAVQQDAAEQQVVEEIPAIKTMASTENMTMEQNAEHPEMQNVSQEKKQADLPELEALEVSAEGVEQKLFSQVETAPVKVSETALEPTVAKNVEHQIDAALTKAVANGETKVELQLTPKHLGKITIELTQKHNGTLEVVLHAENDHTRMLLEREAPNMQHTFGRNTQQDVLVEVPRHQEAQQNDSYDGHQQQRQQQQQEQQHRQKRSEDFLNQMRLGFVPVEEVIV